MPCKIHANRIIFRRQIAEATFQLEVQTDGGGERRFAASSPNGKPFLSFPRRRKRLLYRVAKVERRSIIRPPVAAATFHKRSYERAWLLRQRRGEDSFSLLQSVNPVARAYTRGALRYRDPRVPSLFFADSHLVVLRNSILESCRVGKKKGAGREKEDDRWKRRDVRGEWLRRKAEG